MPADNITATLEEIARIGSTLADALGAAFEIDRPYDLDEEELPVVVMRTGRKEVVEDDDMPDDDWDAIWLLEPSIEVWLTAGTPTQASAMRNAASQLLRQGIKASAILDFTRDGTKPEYGEIPTWVDNKPSIIGIEGQFGLVVYND